MTRQEIESDAAVRASFSVAEADLRSLRDRLAARADEESLLELAYRVVEGPVGRLLLVSGERGLVRVAFDSEGFSAVLAGVAERLSPRLMHAPWKLDPVARELDEYFAGRRQRFDVPLDFTLSSGFRRAVQQELPSIDYGKTSTYGRLAERLGNPRAVRAVGTACATNPLPVVVPCHRVLRSDGSLGGYLGGLQAKSTLLELEHANSTK
ncbi:methylated-DNA--[protein]-cysteine S-methyltransferase [Citricoccus sp. GCM10030269]|uniref:methylated-DNA--[protein]-cysteine S-methyltransferase n=1 Tax=Citricoccus sp. GCM10030269 TaxID=3273388 RepID=UPI00361C3804